jgi:hypothetical protein
MITATVPATSPVMSSYFSESLSMPKPNSTASPDAVPSAPQTGTKSSP